MSYSLVGATYIGSGALPSPVAGYWAEDISTGNIYKANPGATAWILFGNSNQAYAGLVPLTGTTMTGALTGVTGWAPIDSPNFTTTAKINGVAAATINDVTSGDQAVVDSISAKIAAAVASTTVTFSVKSNVAWGMGILQFNTGNSWTNTIPLPTYSDGTTASQADCKWICAPEAMGFAVGLNDSSNENLIYSVDPTTTRTFSCYVQNTVSSVKHDVNLWYFIMGIRA